MPPKKITAENLVIGFWEMQKKGKNTLRNWAVVPIAIGSGVLLDKGNSVSKQGINERLNANCMKMTELIFKKALNFKYKEAREKLESSIELDNINHLFNRILLQKSTIQSLPLNLRVEFPASYTNGKKAAMLRLLPIAIGTIFDLTNMSWVSFFIGSFRNNDQSQTMLIKDVVEKNDLLLRVPIAIGIGYFTLDSLVYFIKHQYVITIPIAIGRDNKSNLYYNTNGSTHEIGEKIDLLKLFKGKTEVDIPIQSR